MVVGIKYFVFIIFVANSYLNPTLVFAENRPRPNVITGGNPAKKNVPWPKDTSANKYYKQRNESTYYKRAAQKNAYYGNVYHDPYCAAHRRGFYGVKIQYKEYRAAVYGFMNNGD